MLRLADCPFRPHKSAVANDRHLLPTPSNYPVRERPRQRVWHGDQYRAQEQGGARVNLPKDQKLRDKVEYYRYCY